MTVSDLGYGGVAAWPPAWTSSLPLSGVLTGHVDPRAQNCGREAWRRRDRDVSREKDRPRLALTGTIVGATVVWFWREQLAAQVEEKSRGLRTKAADGLEIVEKQAEALIDRAKPQITSTLRAGKEAIRPSDDREPTDSRPRDATSATLPSAKTERS